jgi:hypothetical protein
VNKPETNQFIAASSALARLPGDASLRGKEVRMRRIISILTVAVIMATMIVVLAAPAFAQGSDCGGQFSGAAQLEGGVGEVVSSYAVYAGKNWGFALEGLCNPTE